MHKLLFYLVVSVMVLPIFLCFPVMAQIPDNIWAKQFGHGADFLATPRGIIADSDGNVFVTGTFDVTNDFDPGPGIYNLTAAGGADIFIMKLNKNGNLVWAKQIGGTIGDDIASGIAFDKTGNLFITGYFYGSVDFDPGVADNILTANNSFSDVFILKMDTSGNLIWVKRVGGQAGDGAFGICFDTSDNILLSGNFWETSDFDPGPGIQNLTSLANADNFILKLTHEGDFIWVKQIGGAFVAIQSFSIKTDRDNNVITAGNFNGGTCDFDPGPATNIITSVNGNTGYVLKLDANGHYVWVKTFTGNISEVYIKGLSVAASGNIYTVGSFIGTVDFNPGPAVYQLSSQESGMAVKLDSNGNFAWAKPLSFPSLCLTGNSEESVLIGGRNGMHSLSKLDYAGNLKWELFFGNASLSSNTAICTDSLKNIYLGGFFSNTCDFDPSAGVYNLTSVAQSDIFVHKLSELPVLPIHFISLAARSLQDGNLVEWEVTPELQGGGKFIIERSVDGINFIQVDEADLTAGTKLFSFLDTFAQPGVLFYRISSIDASQRVSFSTIVFVNRKKRDYVGVTVWPNPVMDILNIRSGIYYYNAVMNISDINGRLILKKEHCNGNYFSINCAFLTGGVYVLEIEDKIGRKVVKIVKQ